MTNHYVENAEAWKAISNIDYFTHFVKAWIPFNAWYRNSYPTLDSDAAIMQEIKAHPNSFRNRIISLLDNADTINESKVFKSNIAELHYQLERNYIYNKDGRISFMNIVVENNPQTTAEREYRKFSYKVEIDPGNRKRIISTIIDGKAVTRINHIQTNGYNKEELITNEQYKLLPPECQRFLIVCYEDINPRKAISLLTSDVKNCLKIVDYNFINNSLLIAKAVITVIYNLRNSLFHGQLVPNKETQSVYEPAYHLLRMLVISLS